MNETILTWNMTNWITVVVMAMLGFTILGVVAQTARRLRANGAATEA